MREPRVPVKCPRCKETYTRVFCPPGEILGNSRVSAFRSVSDRRVAERAGDRAHYGPCPVCGAPLERVENQRDVRKREVARLQLQQAMR